MLHGFGLYPVSLQIDIDSYDGDWRHVAQFRNRSGWLAVAEAEIWSGNDLCATLPMIVGCDENEEEIPAFIAANLLSCATSYPEACYEPPPPALDDLLDQQRAEVRKRWLRENVAAIAAIHEQAEQALLEVETKVAAQTRKSERAIARMRRQSRFLSPDDPLKTLLADAIAEEEGWQDRMIDWLGERRNELRQHYDELERKASKGLAISRGQRLWQGIGFLQNNHFVRLQDQLCSGTPKIPISKTRGHYLPAIIRPGWRRASLDNNKGALRGFSQFVLSHHRMGGLDGFLTQVLGFSDHVGGRFQSALDEPKRKASENKRSKR